MVKVWQSASGGEVKCECGALYKKTLHRIPQKDSDYFDCNVCGERLDEWRSTTYPTYELIKD